MCGTTLCSPGEGKSNYIVTICSQRPYGDGALYSATICDETLVCSDCPNDEGETYTVYDTEPSSFATKGPSWWAW